MKKSSMKKMIVGILIVLAIVVFMEFLYPVAFVYEPRLVLLTQYVSQYIEEHSQFPDNNDSLKRFIEEKGDSAETLMLDMFKINYDFKCSDIKVVDGRLYNKTNEEVLLISGPRNYGWKIGSLRNSYRTMSFQWYNLICHKHDNQEKITNN